MYSPPPNPQGSLFLIFALEELSSRQSGPPLVHAQTILLPHSLSVFKIVVVLFTHPLPQGGGCLGTPLPSMDAPLSENRPSLIGRT